jgi:hypothetical protein
MSVVRRHIGEGAVSPGKLYSALSDSSYAYEKFNYTVPVTKSAGYGDPTGVTGDINIASFRRLSASIHVKGTQAILAPFANSTNGTLFIEQDQTDDDGVEYIFGQFNTALNPLGVTVNAATGKDRFARLKFSIADVSGTDDCAFGFRKFQTLTANIDDYTDACVLNVISGNVKQETILNNAATVTSATLGTWADGATHELKAVVTNAGVCTLFYDGVAVGTPFQFDTTDPLVPFFFFLNDADVAGAVEFIEFEAGAVEDVDDYRIL